MKVKVKLKVNTNMNVNIDMDMNMSMDMDMDMNINMALIQVLMILPSYKSTAMTSDEFWFNRPVFPARNSRTATLTCL